MICQSYRLRTLQMSISGHYCIRMLFSKFTECVQQLLNELIDSIRFFFSDTILCLLLSGRLASGSVKFFLPASPILSVSMLSIFIWISSDSMVNSTLPFSISSSISFNVFIMSRGIFFAYYTLFCQH